MTLPADYPPEIGALYDALLACATVATTLGITGTSIYYPTAPVGTATLPLIILEPSNEDGQAPWAGGGGLSQWDLVAVIRCDAIAVSSNQAEAYGRSISKELRALQGALPIRSVNVQLASDPESGATAVSDDAGAPTTNQRTITLLIHAGIEE